MVILEVTPWPVGTGASQGLSLNWSRWSAGGLVRAAAHCFKGDFTFHLPELKDKLERRTQGKMWDKGWWVSACRWAVKVRSWGLAGDKWSTAGRKTVGRSGHVVIKLQPIIATWKCKMDHISWFFKKNLEIWVFMRICSIQFKKKFLWAKQNTFDKVLDIPYGLKGPFLILNSPRLLLRAVMCHCWVQGKLGSVVFVFSF